MVASDAKLLPPPASTKADTSWILPLRVHWHGLNETEIAARSYKVYLDMVIGIPFFAIWYAAQAVFVTNPTAFEAASGGVPLSATMWWRFSLAVVSSYIVMVHVVAFPAPTEDLDSFKAQSIVGRWVYLTRHGITLQAWHQIFSLAAIWYPWLETFTVGICVWIATLAWYVTIQYFVLVVPSDAMKKDIELWASRGVDFKEVGLLIHCPPLFIAVLDILVAKGDAELRATLSVARSCVVLVVYSILYLCLIHLNFKLTLAWPYGFLNSFGHNIKKWVSFFCVQVIILLAFSGANWLLVYLHS